MATKYRKGYDLEKMMVDRINKTNEWHAQRAPSSKGVDVVATSSKYYKTVFLECKNTDQPTFRIPRDEIAALVKRARIAGAEAFVAIHWRSRRNKEDARRKHLCFYSTSFLAMQLDSTETKTIGFKPYDFHSTFDDVFSASATKQ